MFINRVQTRSGFNAAELNCSRNNEVYCKRCVLLIFIYIMFDIQNNLVLICCSFLYRVGVISKKFEDVVDQKEKWYGTDFRLEDIPDGKVQVGSASCHAEHALSN